MREFFASIGRGIVKAVKYLWVPVSLFLIYLGLWAFFRFGGLEAIVDWLNDSVNGIGNSMFSEWEVFWVVPAWEWWEIACENSIGLGCFGTIPFLAVCILICIAQLIYCVIKTVFSLIIILLLIILTLVFEILMVFLIPPALGVFAFIVLIKFVGNDESDTVQSIFMIISCILCVVLAVGIYFSIWPYTFGL